MICNDCGFPVSEGYMSERALARGSSVREPGEPLCQNCNSSRVLLVRKLAALPSTLAGIKAMRTSLKERVA